MSFKKKLENYWYYYKWHTVIAVFIIFVVGFTIKSATESKENDLFMVYVSDKAIDTDVSGKLGKDLEKNKLIKDVNGDSEVNFYLDTLVTSLDGNNSDVASMQKLQVYMLAGEQSLMLVHKYIPEDYDGTFEDISAYASEDDTVYKGSNGKITAISVEGNSYLENMGINTENLYIGIHARSDKQIEKHERDAEYKMAHNILKYILKNK